MEYFSPLWDLNTLQAYKNAGPIKNNKDLLKIFLSGFWDSHLKTELRTSPPLFCNTFAFISAIPKVFSFEPDSFTQRQWTAFISFSYVIWLIWVGLHLRGLWV